MKTPVLFMLALLCAGAAHSQAVWRCGADGRVYSDSPCAEGRLVAVTDARNGEQRQAAREVLQRDRALAHELAEQRHERERDWRAAGAGAAGIKQAPQAEPGLKPKRAKAKKHRPEADGTWRAIAQVSR